MQTQEDYVSLLDILSLTREAKNALAVAMEQAEEALKAIQSSEQLVVADVLRGRKLVAYSQSGKLTGFQSKGEDEG